MSLRKKSNSSLNTTAEGSNEIPDSHDVKRGRLLKRHRHKNNWITRDIVLDCTDRTLSYYKPKTSLARVAGKISRSITSSLSTNVTKGTSDGEVKSDSESEMKRLLPVCNLHVCILDTDDQTECEEIGEGRILTISYSESMTATSSVTTRSLFFKSEKPAGSEEADEEIEDWLTAILRVKESDPSSLDQKSSGSGSDLIGCTTPAVMLNVDDQSTDESTKFDPVHCGWIYKKGSQLNSKWQKRWLFLDCSTLQLRYYKSPVDALPQGEIPLDVCRQVKKGMPDLFPEANPPHTFTVVCKDRSYWIRTDSAEATQEWIDLIEVCLGGLGENPQTIRSQSVSLRPARATTPQPRRLTISVSKI